MAVIASDAQTSLTVHQAAGRVHHPRAVGVDLADRRDPAVGEQHVGARRAARTDDRASHHRRCRIS